MGEPWYSKIQNKHVQSKHQTSDECCQNTVLPKRALDQFLVLLLHKQKLAEQQEDWYYVWTLMVAFIQKVLAFVLSSNTQ